MAKPVLLPSGSLDSGFSADGRTGAAIGTGHDQARAIAIQSDGKYVLAGWNDNATVSDFAVVRFNADGSLDTTFSGDGKLTTAFTGRDEACGVAIQSNGKIVVGGSTNVLSNNADFALVRYNANGSLDTSFGGDGKVTTSLSAGQDLAGEIVIQADGKILVVGAKDSGSQFGQMALVRYNSTGSLDNTFGSAGIALADFSAFDNGEAIALQTDGKIVVAGYVWTGTEYNFTVARFNAIGTLDTTFSSDGKHTFSLNPVDQIYSVAVQADGKILLAGTTGTANFSASDAVLIRLKSNGDFDTTFGGGDGIVTLNVSSSDAFNSVVVQADDKILLAGNVGFDAAEGIGGSGLGDALIARYDAVGTLDTSFSGDGLLLTSFGAGTAGIYDLAVAPSGQVVAAGDNFTGSTQDFGLLRLGSAVGDRIATSGDAFSYAVPAGAFFDPDGDTLAYAATLANGSPLPSWLTFNPSTRTFSGTPADGDFGTQQVKVTASDASAAVAANFQLEVTTDFIEALRYTDHARWNDASPHGTSGTTLTFSFMTGVPSYATSPVETNTFQAMGSAQKAAVRSVLALYQEIAGVTFVEVADAGAGGQLRFGTYFSNAETESAYANSPSFSQAAGDVWVNRFYEHYDTPVAGDSHYETLLHEVGHALGLKHPGDYGGGEGPFLLTGVDSNQYTVMSYNNRSGDIFLDVTELPSGEFDLDFHPVSASTQMLYDVAAIQFLYGANLATRAGNDTYTFNPAAPFFKTLWDGGGTDTISVSNFSESCIIDLRDGQFSTLRILSEPLPPGYTGSVGDYNGANNLAIALDVVIENAVGGAGNDTLTGNAANNVLNGGAGNDTLNGGLGNDTYVRDTAGDLVTELSGQGTDTVQSAVTYTLPVNVENLTLTGVVAIDGTGNTDNNVLTGNSGNNVLNGSTGTDTASYASATAGVTVNLGVVAAQNTVGAGTDTLTLIENLTGGGFNDTLTGNSGNNVLNGSSGTDTASYASATLGVTVNLGSAAQNTVGAGTDTLSSIENLTGSASNDTLTGNSGNNVLNGGSGADTMAGGLGNDTYVVNAVSDVVTEVLDGGTDLVQSTAGTHTLSDNVENLTLLGTGNIKGTGNTLSNVLTGNSGNNTLNGSSGTDTASYASAAAGVTVKLGSAAQNTVGAGTDTLSSIENLTGSAFNDTLTGNSVNNILNGGLGNDTLNGGLGNDTLNGSTGTDTASYASATAGVTVNLGSAAQNTIGAGTDTLSSIENLTGSGFNDTLTGNTGANVLNGGLGNDTLSGGTGLDIFRFNTALGASNIDQISGFVVVDDTIQLENAVFTSLASGALATTHLRKGAGVTTAADANDFLIYNTTTGALFYDADGLGGASAQQFATLTGTPAILASDFSVT